MIHDNLSTGESFDSWRCVFDEHSVPPDDGRTPGIAANDAARHGSHLLEVDELEHVSLNRNHVPVVPIQGNMLQC